MTGQVRVLCVDDDPSAVDLTAKQLEVKGDEIDVVTATTVSDALTLLQERSLDCVVSDYEMRSKDGLEFLREIRDREIDVPFILFTGRGSEAVASKAISAGVTDYLQKGDAEQYKLLANRVQNAIASHRAKVELQETNERLQRLNQAAVDIASADDEEELYDRTLDIADEVLEFDICGIYAAEDGTFVPKTDRSFRPAGGLREVDEGVIGKTFRTGESTLLNELANSNVALPASKSLRSALSVPIGDFGVFQAASQEPSAFEEQDRKLAELLMTHAAQVLDRIAHEQDLRETNERLETILQNTTAIIYMKDLDGRYTLVNDRYTQVLGMDEEEILGKTDWEIQEREYAAEVRENDRKAIEEERPVETEERAHRGGAVRTYYSIKVPIYGEDGDPTGVCGISSDITELKRREKELREQKNRLDKFASVISHDLRNPLTVANGYLELLLQERDDSRLENIADALVQMEMIIEDLLQLAHNGQQIGETEPVSLVTQAERAWENVDNGSAELRIQSDPVVDADPDRLVQALENLFQNAVDHGGQSAPSVVGDGDPEEAKQVSKTEDGSPDEAVTVMVGELDDRTGFYVEDDGPGFPDGSLEEVLEPGFSTIEDGTGFGLAIVESVANAHGWDVWLGTSDSGGARIEIVVAND